MFSCPAISRAVSTPDGVKSAVYAVMENVQAINADERGRTVRAWVDHMSGEGSSSSVQQRMFSAVVCNS
jgi:site-specific DNA-cytosine methylase